MLARSAGSLGVIPVSIQLLDIAHRLAPNSQPKRKPPLQKLAKAAKSRKELHATSDSNPLFEFDIILIVLAVIGLEILRNGIFKVLVIFNSLIWYSF